MSALISLAKNLATRAHAGQFRRDGKTPYIKHVEAVAKLVEESRGDEESVVVAWLHDVIEDTDIDVGQLRVLGIPERLIGYVLMLTWEPNQKYCEYISSIASEPSGVVSFVKTADILCNLTDEPTPRQKQKYISALMQLASRHENHHPR